MKGSSWSGGQTPEQLLRAATVHLPGCSVQLSEAVAEAGAGSKPPTAAAATTTNEVSDQAGAQAAAPATASDAKPAEEESEWACSGQATIAGQTHSSTASGHESADAARQQVALDLLHKCVGTDFR